MSPTRIRPVWFVDLLVFSLALLACGRWGLPLLEPEESRYAELSRQMLETGSWIVPTLDGQPYLDKPPLLYWLVAGSYSLFGISIPAARIVPGLFAAGTVWVVYRWGRSASGVTSGIVSAAILVSLPDFLYRAPMLTMNGLLAFATTLALACGYRAVAFGRFSWQWWSIAAVVCGFGILAKGPIALALVVAPFTVVSFFDRRIPRVSLAAWLAFTAIVLIVAGPWFIAVARQHPEFLNYFFWKHHVERVVQPFDHAKPWWFYLPQVAIGMLPWTPGIGLAGLTWIRRTIVSPIVPFGIIAGLMAFVLFSISGSKRPVYLVPIYPMFAMAFGAWLTDRFAASGSRHWGLSRAGWSRILSFVCVSVVVGMLIVLPSYHRRYSAGPLLESLQATDRVYAVPSSSLAASFARRQIVPTISWEKISGITAPSGTGRIVLVIPTRHLNESLEWIDQSNWSIRQGSELTLLIHPRER